eukprot:IDg4499t1
MRNIHKHVLDIKKLEGKLDTSHSFRLRKATQKHFGSRFKDVSHAREIVHSELTENLQKRLDGAQYACSFTDQFSIFSHVTGLKLKSDALDAVKAYNQLENVTKYFKKGLQRLHTDGGGEYTGVATSEHTEAV